MTTNPTTAPTVPTARGRTRTTTAARTLSDSATMLRRTLLHAVRYPVLTLMVAGIPVILLLLFVFVLGETLGRGMGGAGTRADYLAYLVPGMLVLAPTSGAQGTAITVATDMAEGIIARFRTMSIARASVLTGHVVGATLQTMAGLLLVLVAALLMGYRPVADLPGWLAVLGLLTLLSLAMSWLAVAMGLATKTVEGASNLPMPLMLLPFLGSAFVTTQSMPAGLRWFADNQPFTPIIETLRGLLIGGPVAEHAPVAVAWCLGISLVGYLWARASYERRPIR